ncbi:hypothetical protein Tco_0741431 [Tanacetum coccineum]
MNKSVIASYSSSIVNIKSIIPMKVKCACIFTDRWRLDELAYGIPSDGPYQTNPPSIEDIISSIRIDQEAFRGNHLGKHLLSGGDRGTRRGRPSTSSSTFDQPSSSHLNDDDDDGNDEGTSCASTPSPIRYVNFLTNQVPQVFQNPPNIDSYLEPLYTRQTEIINHQVQLRDEQCGGLRSIEKGFWNLWKNLKKK